MHTFATPLLSVHMGSSSNLGKKSCDNVPLSLKGLNLELFRSKIFAKTNKFATPFLQGWEFAHTLIAHALIHSLLMRSFTHRSCAHSLIAHALIHSLLMHSFTHRSCAHSLIAHALICSFRSNYTVKVTDLTMFVYCSSCKYLILV